MIDQGAATRLHTAAKIIEADGVHGYTTCRERYGEEIANALIIAFLRRNLNPKDEWPEPETLIEEVNKVLLGEKIMEQKKTEVVVRAVELLIQNCVEGKLEIREAAERIVFVLT